MKKFCCFVSFVMAFLLTLSACGKQNSSATTHPLETASIPDSGYAQVFAPIESATLYVNGTKQALSLDDPRLGNVINFLGYSAVDARLHGRLQGKLDAEAIGLYYASRETMLEVTFAGDLSDHDGLRYVTKILIGGDSFVYFVNDDFSASVIWPYANYAPDNARRSASVPEHGWDGEYWLDILGYCGF